MGGSCFYGFPHFFIMSKMIKCRRCGQEVPEDNLRCYFCGNLLDISVGPLSFLSNSNRGLIIGVIALFLIILLLYWLL